MGSFYVYTEIAGDVLVAGNGADDASIGLFYSPSGKIFLRLLLKIIGHCTLITGLVVMAEKKNKKGNTVEAVSELVRPIIEDMGLTLWDVRFVKEGALWYLRIFIDKDSGITVDDCENVTRAVDKPLDDLDPIEQNYILEVSSPGIERELLKPEHFDAFLGAPVMIKLIRPDEKGERELSGTLTAHDKESVTIMCEGEEKVINKKDTVYIKLDDFDL